VDEFGTIVETLGFGNAVNYIGGDSPRDKVKDHVYTASEAPPSLMIPLHNEMSFVKHYPRHIYFYCDVPPKAGGETIVADSRKIYQCIDPDVKARFLQHGLKYISNYYGKSLVLDLVNRFVRAHRTWMEAFETDFKEKAEELCSLNEFVFQWDKRDWLQVISQAPAVIRHPDTGEEVWFNQAHLFDYNLRLLGFWKWVGTKIIYAGRNKEVHEIYYGNGNPMNRKDLYHVMDVLEAQTVRFPWHKGDVMVLDNILAMHGRASFKGKRRILVSLTR
jgi:alpha-ketoglutarate-dependent taurine dioxygenase